MRFGKRALLELILLCILCPLAQTDLEVPPCTTYYHCDASTFAAGAGAPVPSVDSASSAVWNDVLATESCSYRKNTLVLEAWIRESWSHGGLETCSRGGCMACLMKYVT